MSAVKRNIQDKNNEYKKLILSSRNKDEVKNLKRVIRANNKEISLLKYVGSQFKFIEKMWIIGVVASIALTWLGIFIFISSL